MQNVWQHVCLVYARAIPPPLDASMPQPLLAMTDLDERPPPTLQSAVLSTMQHQGRSAGVRLFFDSEHRCRGGCPCGSASFASQCGRGSETEETIYRHYRWVWKPIVVPRRVIDVGTHGFAWRSHSGRGVKSNILRPEPDDTSVFCPCIMHTSRARREPLSVSRGAL